ncbi:hypothetical protein PVK06_040345 [Gossypium arboreum]|uniref:Transposase MuDR plant domain-containing protein n=1 Tax=Gossypium arboreum TaxID=29729 RepID=A0ABR0N7C5_GOSAR|nr:hypothetical protein PVK06_040345 [Gossypium arboreum]
MKHPEEGMMYSLRHPPARGPRSLQMMVGRMMSPMWIYLESSAPMVQKLDYFFELEPVPTIPEDVEGGSDEEEEDLRFKVYSPSAHMHNVDLSQDDALEFPDLPHRRHDRTSSSSDSSEIEVGREFSNKGSFLTALKQHSIMSGVNYNVVKSKSNKFEAKCALQDGTCSWKIMTSLRKRTGLWEIKKYKGLHTCVGGKVMERYVPGCITDLEMAPAYYNDRLLRGCQVFKRLFWSFKHCQDAFIYCKPLVQIDGTFMYGRYTHQLLLAVAQDGSGRIIPIAFAITPGESADDWDFFLSRLRRHVCP